MAKRSNRLVPKSRFTSTRRALPRYGGKGSVLVGRTLTGASIVAMPHHSKKPCIPSKGKALGKTACRSELVFGAEGPKLRFCSTKGKAGPTVSVSSPGEATRLSRAFCACVKRTKNAKACAVKAAKR